MDSSILVLYRYPEYFGCTPGELRFEGHLVCHTIECPWLENRKDISCIPLGKYDLSITQSSRFKRPLPLISRVPDRSGIRIHAANKFTELQGCIAAVKELRIASELVVGGYSRIAVDTVMKLIKTATILTLDVRKL